jgi:uncharacterized membrane protein
MRQHAWTKAGFVLHLSSLIFCIVAILTGDYEESRIAQTPAIHQLAETHETLAMVATWGLGLLAVWAYLRQQASSPLERIAFLLAYFGMIGLIGYSAHLGGAMVFGHGAGVAPMQEIIESARDTSAKLQPLLP